MASAGRGTPPAEVRWARPSWGRTPGGDAHGPHRAAAPFPERTPGDHATWAASRCGRRLPGPARPDDGGVDRAGPAMRRHISVATYGSGSDEWLAPRSAADGRRSRTTRGPRWSMTVRRLPLLRWHRNRAAYPATCSLRGVRTIGDAADVHRPAAPLSRRQPARAGLRPRARRHAPATSPPRIPPRPRVRHAPNGWCLTRG